MKPSGVCRIATDSAGYADSMRDVLDSHPGLINAPASSASLRWEERPITQFEQRALDAGRQIFDLAYRRVD